MYIVSFEITAPCPQQGAITHAEFYSQERFKAWFNGRSVGRFDGDRAYTPDQDVLRVKGVRGVNKILLKITQGVGGWEFGVRLTDTVNVPVDLNVE